MKKSLLALDVIFVIALLFSAYSLYTAVVPILEGDVSIEMQDEDDIEWEFSNETVSAHTWVDIINGGNYEIRDSTLHIWMIHNESGIPVLNIKKTVPPVPAGTTHRENIDVRIDLGILPDELKNNLWKEYANFTIYAEITAYFMNRGGEIKVHYRNTIPWEPLIKQMDIDRDNATIYYDSSTGDMSIYVPYSISTSSLLSGSAEVNVDIYNGSSVLSYTTVYVNMGEEDRGNMIFNISARDTYYLMTHSMILPIRSTVKYSGMSLEFSENYTWGAPFDELHIGEMQTSLNTIWVDYSFTNDYVRDLDLSINTVVYDSSGNIVGSQDDHYIAYVGSNTSRRISVSVSGYPDYAMISITENVSGWHYTVRRYA